MHRRIVPLVATCMLVWLGCRDTTIVANQPVANRPPSILYADALSADIFGPPRFELIAGDPDGLDDIAAVFLDVDSIEVLRVIARPSTVHTSGCLTSVYAPNDTIPITAFVPRRSRGLGRVVMEHVNGGLFRAAPICSSSVHCSCGPCLRTPPLGHIAWSGCLFANSVDYLTISPPAVSSPVNVFVTYLDVEYQGVRATVYDVSGEFTSRTLPDIRVVYTTPEERTVEP